MTLQAFVDTANLEEAGVWASHPLVGGFTTNPTLMRKAGVSDYRTFAKQFLRKAGGLPVSFEVLADTGAEILTQAHEIASWGSNVYVKVPVCTTSGTSLAPIIESLSRANVKLNVTAIFTVDQIDAVLQALGPNADALVSIFAGRIADTGVDPVDIVAHAVNGASCTPKIRILWASPREILNFRQAEQVGCDVITMTPELWKRLDLLDKDLEQFSVETVQMFVSDAIDAGFNL